MAATVHGLGQGESLRAGAGEVLIKATGEDTGGTAFLSETTLPPGFPGPPLHVHDRLHDMFYVLEGELTLRIGDEDERTALPGTFACFPPGVPHTFSNRTDSQVRMLNFNTPAGWEGYMRELAAAYGGDEPVTPEKMGEIASRYDFRVA